MTQSNKKKLSKSSFTYLVHSPSVQNSLHCNGCAVTMTSEIPALLVTFLRGPTYFILGSMHIFGAASPCLL